MYNGIIFLSRAGHEPLAGLVPRRRAEAECDDRHPLQVEVVQKRDWELLLLGGQQDNTEEELTRSRNL